MVGIISYGAYIPVHRVGSETRGWGSPIEKAVAYYDEDSLTMAVAAAVDCLGDIDRRTVDGLYFASTTSPYQEKLASTTVATAVDLRDDILTADCTSSLRSGTSALKMAADAVKAGSAKKLLVTAADCRIGEPRGTFDQNTGHGAAAFLIGDTDVAATIEGSYSISNEMLDVWRVDTGKYVQSWEDRFVYEEGYFKILPRVVGELLKRCGLTPGDVNKAVFYGPDRRRHTDMGRRLGFQPPQIQDPFFGKLGNTGAAFVPMMLVAALEDANPGDRILCAGYGNGADAFLLEVTVKIAEIRGRRGMKHDLASKMTLSDYGAYLGFRHLTLGEAGPGQQPRPSASCIWRERDAIFRLYGSKCRACGTIQYPPQRVCTNCQAKDTFDPVRLSDKKGKVFTYSLDFLAAVPSCDLPMVDTMVDFEGGGRGNFMMTDREPKEVKIGMEVEMSFRKLHTAGGIHNYFWKCVPCRESRQAKETG